MEALICTDFGLGGADIVTLQHSDWCAAEWLVWADINNQRPKS